VQVGQGSAGGFGDLFWVAAMARQVRARVVAVSGGITSRSRCEESRPVTLIVCVSQAPDQSTGWPRAVICWGRVPGVGVQRDPIYHAQPVSHCGDQGG
jgi:hypothetical protein